MTFNRVDFGNHFDLLSRLGLVTAYDPGSLCEILHQIPARRNTHWCQMYGRLKCLLYFSGDKETVVLFSFSAVGSAEPSAVLGILRVQPDRLFAVRDRIVVVAKLVIRTESPKMQGGVFRRFGKGRSDRLYGGGIISGLELRAGRIRWLRGSHGR